MFGANPRSTAPQRTTPRPTASRLLRHVVTNSSTIVMQLHVPKTTERNHRKSASILHTRIHNTYTCMHRDVHKHRKEYAHIRTAENVAQLNSTAHPFSITYSKERRNVLATNIAGIHIVKTYLECKYQMVPYQGAKPLIHHYRFICVLDVVMLARVRRFPRMPLLQPTQSYTSSRLNHGHFMSFSMHS